MSEVIFIVTTVEEKMSLCEFIFRFSHILIKDCDLSVLFKIKSFDYVTDFPLPLLAL